MTKYRIVNEVVPFSEETLTERGEKVYTTFEIIAYPPAASPVKRVIQADPGMGFTEEWIEDTITGCLESLRKDFPNDVYRVVRLRPNQIRLEYAGVTGFVQ